MSKTKIVVFGDSVTAGTSIKLDVFHDCFQYGTTTVNTVRETQTWRSIMERILSDWVDDGVEVINAGIAGSISSKGLARLERDVLSCSPDYVLVIFGVEDVLAGVETEAFRESLDKIVDGIVAQNARPVLMTPTPISERMTVSGCTIYELRQRQECLSRLAQVVRSLADEKSLALIDLHRYFLDNRLAYDHLFEGWLPDGVAQSGMASFVAGELLPMLGVNAFPKPILCDYRKIYSDAEHFDIKHNGFTDFTYFQGEFYAAFRSGHSHGLSGGGHAKSIVLRSKDGVNWTKDAMLQVEDFIETRDPKFLQAEDRLLLYGVCWPVAQQADTYWTTYGFERLGDGHTWETASTILGYETDGNESDLFVEDDRLMAFSRAGDGSKNEMLISTYIPSENRWKTVSSGRIIHAPCVFKAGNRTMITGRYCSQSDERFRALREDWQKFTSDDNAEAAGADPARVEEYHHGLRTGVFVMDGTRPRLVMELLSAGDSSYTGAVQYGDEYLISDYSMHEYYPEIKRPEDWSTPCDIYVSRIRFGGSIS
jgi:lysophospholipase L1-like esterase